MKNLSFNRALFIIAMLFLFSCALERAERPRAWAEGKRWAVVVGVNDYLYEIDPLYCAVKDAERFKRTLIRRAGFKEDNIFLLTSGSPNTNIPTRVNIKKFLNEVKEKARPGDMFIFFFSGHGVDIDGEIYFMNFDTDPFSGATIKNSALRISDLMTIIRDMPSDCKLIFSDACRVDPTKPASVTSKPLDEGMAKSLIITPRNDQKKGADGSLTQTFLSCSVGESSFEYSEKGLGFFTYHLVNALDGEGKARDSSGRLTLGSLKSYLRTEVPAVVYEKRGKRQHPWYGGNAPMEADGWAFNDLSSMAVAMTTQNPLRGTPETTPTPPATPFTPPTPAAPSTPAAPPTPAAPSRPTVREEAEQFVSKGNDYYKKKDYTQAAEEYTRAIEKDPGYALAYFNRGNTFHLKMEYDRALADYNASLRIAPNSVRTFTNLGIIYMLKKEFDKSMECFNRGISIDPKHARLYTNRSFIYLQRDDKERGLADLRKALELDPLGYHNFYLLGITYTNFREFDKAIPHFNRAIEIAEEYPLSYYGRGVTYMFKGDLTQARADFRHFLDIATPEFKDAIHNAKKCLSEMEGK